ncbi:hypothetical protein [Azohydromonas australica]|uniref:hypothetical protein n=1 Tax=Azohydromonas australica TaxID=364039 RepID=UPI0012EBFB4C|nr:hypothetical protein [Azohydromonas australica]
MHDTYHVGWTAPGHCPGKSTLKALQAVFGDHDLYAGVDSRIDLGAMPRLAAAEAAAPWPKLTLPIGAGCWPEVTTPFPQESLVVAALRKSPAWRKCLPPLRSCHSGKRAVPRRMNRLMRQRADRGM